MRDEVVVQAAPLVHLQHQAALLRHVGLRKIFGNDQKIFVRVQSLVTLLERLEMADTSLRLLPSSLLLRRPRPGAPPHSCRSETRRLGNFSPFKPWTHNTHCSLSSSKWRTSSTHSLTWLPGEGEAAVPAAEADRAAAVRVRVLGGRGAGVRVPLEVSQG